MKTPKEPTPRRHGNRWRISIRKFSRRTFKTCDTAELCLEWWRAQHKLKAQAPDNPLTIGEVCDAILLDVKRRFRPGTYEFWDSNFKTIRRFFDDARGVHEVTTQDIEKFFQTAFFKTAKSKIKKRYSATSGDIHWRTLSRIFVYAKKRGLIITNPLDDDELRQVRPREDPRTFAFTRDEVGKIIADIASLPQGRGKGMCEDPKFHAAVVALAYYTGSRRGEMARMTVDDIDLRADTVRIQSFGRRTKKGRRNPLPPKFIPTMRYLVERSKAGGFDNLLGVNESGIDTVFDRRADNLKLRGKLTCHVMRHSAASALAAAKKTGIEIADWLGDSVDVGMRYVKLFGPQRLAVVEAL